jgi:DNA modification methylase
MDYLELNKIHLMNCVDGLKLLRPKSINSCVTSPPYYALRDYGLEPTVWPPVSYKLFGFTINVAPMRCCLGLEPTPQDYIGHLVYIFRLVRETLADDGTCWINIGDSYSANQKTRSDEQAVRKSTMNGTKGTQIACKNQQSKIFKQINIKPKDLIGIPWMLAFALREDGWYLRQDIIWHKPNPMPESVTDRCTKAHEYIFLLSKSAKYYYDHEAIMQPIALSSVDRLKQDIENQQGSGRVPGKTNGAMKAVGQKNLQRADKNHSFHEVRANGRKPRPSDSRGGNQGTGEIPMGIHGKGFTGHSGYFDRDGNLIGNGKANKRSVWSVTTQPFKDAHFAVFPPELIMDCIKAGSAGGG